MLVFGESVNDSQSITHLLIGANASLADRVRSLRRPVSLTRDAKPNAVRDWVNELRRTVQAFEAVNGRVAAVVAWWFLFPEAVEAVRPRAWKDSLPRQPRDVELIDQPKKALRQATRDRRAPEYAESDSPTIAAYIREKSLIPLCPCRSYDRMVTLARTII